MDAHHRVGDDTHILPSHIPIPGTGVLPVNAFVIESQDPVLVDAGMGIDSDAFIEALSSIVALEDLKWIWLTHDDAEHVGSLQRILQLAPQARVATHAFAAFRLSTAWEFPLDRVRALRPGDCLDVGDRKLRAVRPPLFDNPLSTGALDEKTGNFFCVDAFGAFLPECADDASAYSEKDLKEGMVSWATFDSPWAHLVAKDSYADVLDQVRRMKPQSLFSSHLPPALEMTASFLEILATVPDAEPMVPPDDAAFHAMLAG